MFDQLFDGLFSLMKIGAVLAVVAWALSKLVRHGAKVREEQNNERGLGRSQPHPAPKGVEPAAAEGEDRCWRCSSSAVDPEDADDPEEAGDSYVESDPECLYCGGTGIDYEDADTCDTCDGSECDECDMTGFADCVTRKSRDEDDTRGGGEDPSGDDDDQDDADVYDDVEGDADFYDDDFSEAPPLAELADRAVANAGILAVSTLTASRSNALVGTWSDSRERSLLESLQAVGTFYVTDRDPAFGKRGASSAFAERWVHAVGAAVERAFGTRAKEHLEHYITSSPLVEHSEGITAAVATDLAFSCFGKAPQACTASERSLVEQIASEFVRHLTKFLYPSRMGDLGAPSIQ